jgi:hypothetical protein
LDLFGNPVFAVTDATWSRQGDLSEASAGRDRRFGISWEERGVLAEVSERPPCHECANAFVKY